MPCLIALLHTLFPMLFASGKAVSALKLNFDRNSNIVSLQRYGAKNYNTGALLDDLTMTYQGNQLRYITDDATDYPYEASLDFRAKAPIASTPGASVAAPFGLIGGFNPIDTTVVKPNPNPGINPVSPTYSADYAYDANGNMTQDRHSSITSIAYNVLNLPQTVTYEGLTINRPVSQIVYDASGKKHIVRNGALRLNKFSGDETRYIGDYIMVNDTIDRLQTPYGYLRDGIFHSYVFDYQGNVMAVVAGNDVTQTNLYYADGLPMNTSTNPTANAFKYTAKELSLFRGLPVYDYTARHTLPQINRFRTMDPLAEKYHGISPYAFCAGDPINFSDPTGKTTLRIDLNGQSHSVVNDGDNSITIIFYKNNIESAPITLDPNKFLSIHHYDAPNGYKYLVLAIRGDSNGQALFESAANIDIDSSEKVEYTLWQVGQEGDKGLNYLSTSGMNDKDYSGSYVFSDRLKYGYTLRNEFHNHPYNSPPSGYDESNTSGDKFHAEYVSKNCAGSIPKFAVYRYGNYHYYESSTAKKSIYKLKDILQINIFNRK